MEIYNDDRFFFYYFFWFQAKTIKIKTIGKIYARFMNSNAVKIFYK